MLYLWVGYQKRNQNQKQSPAFGDDYLAKKMRNAILTTTHNNGTYCHFAVRLYGGGAHIDCFLCA